MSKSENCLLIDLVCGIVKSWNPVDDPDQEHVQLENVIPVAGNFAQSTGKSLDPKVTRLKASDAATEGLRLELNGGSYNKMKQKAVIEFQCDPDRTGNEGNEAAEDKKKREEDGTVDDSSSLSYVSYDVVDGKEQVKVLRLNWRTKYACEDFVDDEPQEKEASWGFFTWLILL